METMEERFWKKVNKDGPIKSHCQHLGPCWILMASKRNKGYGAFCYIRDGVIVHGRSHRYIWEMSYGPIPVGLCVLHACDTPACVNPLHLWLGTKADNNADMIRKGRNVKGNTYSEGHYKRGITHHNTRLTEEQVREMRGKYADGRTSFNTLAQEYKIAIAHAYRIVRRKAWKHVQ